MMKLLALLSIVLMALKMTGYTAMSWWLVTIPLWVGWPLCIGAGMLLLCFAAWAEANK